MKNLIETAEDQPDCGVVGAIEEAYQTGEIRAVGGKNFSFLKARGQWIKEMPTSGGRILDVDYVQGSMVLFSKKGLQRGIRLDEKLFMYCEEVDLGFQLKKKGLKAYTDLRCRVRHKGVPKKLTAYQGYLIQRNRLYLCRKHATRLTYLFSALYMGLLEIPAKWFLRSLQGNFHYGWVCFLGFLDALVGRLGYGRCQQLQ